ncbi:hypothetical protein GALMADRAFT_1086531 [Galerina marginata CBS 339.88]|uniref:Uncharacterized protein n=1 Tax=Galerina marginata (strain CBS 339.88) TaxID=685588 RepID=A0A067SID0_GALM3|nr:hypothetical protein GALMADRAFT_1086531 [Galerina marginata CBS 339.88]
MCIEDGQWSTVKREGKGGANDRKERGKEGGERDERRVNGTQGRGVVQGWSQGTEPQPNQAKPNRQSIPLRELTLTRIIISTVDQHVQFFQSNLPRRIRPPSLVHPSSEPYERELNHYSTGMHTSQRSEIPEACTRWSQFAHRPQRIASVKSSSLRLLEPLSWAGASRNSMWLALGICG